MVRKVMLNLILVLMASASALAQGVVVNLIIGTFIVLHLYNQPYENDILNRIELGSLLLAACVLQFGFFLFDDDMEDGVKSAITVFMIILITLCLLVFVGILCRHVKKNRTDDMREGVAQAREGVVNGIIKARKGMGKAREKALHTLEGGVEMVGKHVRGLSRGMPPAVDSDENVQIEMENPIGRQSNC